MWGWSLPVGASLPHLQDEGWDENGSLCSTFHSDHSLRAETGPRPSRSGAPCGQNNWLFDQIAPFFNTVFGSMSMGKIIIIIMSSSFQFLGYLPMALFPGLMQPLAHPRCPVNGMMRASACDNAQRGALGAGSGPRFGPSSAQTSSLGRCGASRARARGITRMPVQTSGGGALLWPAPHAGPGSALLCVAWLCGWERRGCHGR